MRIRSPSRAVRRRYTAVHGQRRINQTDLFARLSRPNAALREVREETGFRCRATDLAGIASYTTGTGEDKVVNYWVMAVIDGAFTPNDEVDRIEWLAPNRALELLSYDLDRDLVRTTLDTQ